jgi:hypothetical protein
MSCTKIIDYLYLGSYHDMLEGHHKEIGANVIINVAKECKQIDHKLEYYHFKFDDSIYENVFDDFDKMADLIHQKIQLRQIVFIHCFAGKSRSASFVILYLMKWNKMDLQSAFQYVNQLRPIAPNSGFIQQLTLYEMNAGGSLDNAMIDHIYDVAGFATKEQVAQLYHHFNKDVDLTMTALFQRYFR